MKHTGFEYAERLRNAHFSRYAEDLEDTGMDLRLPYSPRDILDVIVQLEDGLSCGTEVTELVMLLWGCNLPEEAYWR